ncbi:MAG: hypothetical protein KDD43_15065, partial [Bdellovibrionales bacterium]|nr:hypothetical protein [Bdellovibrionales bacterium]
MACPGESASEFRSSLHDLIEMGFHDEIRTHLYSILPNAPAADPEYMKENAIEVIERPMNQQRVDRELVTNPYAGRSQFVVGHRSLNREGLKDEMCYSVHIFLNHNFALSRFVAIFLAREYGIAYSEFYESYYSFLRGQDTLVGQVFDQIDAKMEEFYLNPTALLVFDLGKGAALYEPEEFALHKTLAGLGRYYDEFWEFVDSFVDQRVKSDPRFEDLRSYQQNVIVTDAYDPRLGREFNCRYDWPAYFADQSESVQTLPVGYRLEANDVV